MCLSDDILRGVLKEFDSTIKHEIEEEVRKMYGHRGCKWSMKGTSVGYRNIDHYWTFEVKNARMIREPDQFSSPKIKVNVHSVGDPDRKRKM